LEREQQAVANRQTTGLLALAIVLVLLITGLFLVQRLQHTTSIEDCVMAGRRNCDPALTHAP
jgi:hypothetical protein